MESFKSIIVMALLILHSPISTGNQERLSFLLNKDNNVTNLLKNKVDFWFKILLLESKMSPGISHSQLVLSKVSTH